MASTKVFPIFQRILIVKNGNNNNFKSIVDLFFYNDNKKIGEFIFGLRNNNFYEYYFKGVITINNKEEIQLVFGGNFKCDTFFISFSYSSNTDCFSLIEHVSKYVDDYDGIKKRYETRISLFRVFGKKDKKSLIKMVCCF